MKYLQRKHFFLPKYIPTYRMERKKHSNWPRKQHKDLKFLVLKFMAFRCGVCPISAHFRPVQSALMKKREKKTTTKNTYDERQLKATTQVE